MAELLQSNKIRRRSRKIKVSVELYAGQRNVQALPVADCQQNADRWTTPDHGHGIGGGSEWNGIYESAYRFNESVAGNLQRARCPYGYRTAGGVMGLAKVHKQNQEWVAKRVQSAIRTRRENGYKRPSGLKYNISEKTREIYCKNMKNLQEKVRATRVQGPCVTCGSHVSKPKRYRGKPLFCSHACYGKSLVGKPSWNKGNKGYLAGEKHYNWKGGITGLAESERSSLEWKEWRHAVFARDDYKCRLCATTGKILHPHHILFRSKFPQFKFEAWNGKTLCVSCHRRVHSKSFPRQGGLQFHIPT